jgi:hypothetical protein
MVIWHDICKFQAQINIWGGMLENNFTWEDMLENNINYILKPYLTT